MKRCRRGHEMTEENSRWRTLAGGKYRVRGCRLCTNASARLRYRRAAVGQVTAPVQAWEFARQ